MLYEMKKMVSGQMIAQPCAVLEVVVDSKLVQSTKQENELGLIRRIYSFVLNENSPPVEFIEVMGTGEIDEEYVRDQVVEYLVKRNQEGYINVRYAWSM